MKAGLVLTSINDPICLDGYIENFKKYGHLDDVEVFMIPDVKTPRAAYDRCVNLTQNGLSVWFPGFPEQAAVLSKHGLKSEMVPWNSDNRRNIGYLMALAAHPDFIISIDDDNYCMQEHDYFANHALARGSSPECVSISGGWLNPCDWLSTDVGVYQRGFPYYARAGVCASKLETGNFKIHVNEGLWTRDPDLDAMTWLTNPAWSVGCPSPIVVAQDTWAPINSQNTDRKSVM